MSMYFRNNECMTEDIFMIISDDESSICHELNENSICMTAKIKKLSNEKITDSTKILDHRISSMKLNNESKANQKLYDDSISLIDSSFKLDVSPRSDLPSTNNTESALCEAALIPRVVILSDRETVQTKLFNHNKKCFSFVTMSDDENSPSKGALEQDTVCIINSPVNLDEKLDTSLLSSTITNDLEFLKVNQGLNQMILSEEKTVQVKKPDCTEKKSFFKTFSSNEIINEASKKNSACIINLSSNCEKTDNKLKYNLSLSTNANNLEFCNFDQSERNIIGVSNNENKSGQKTIEDIACKTYYPRKPDGELKSSVPSSSNTDNLEFCKVNNSSEEMILSEEKTVQVKKPDCTEKKSFFFKTFSSNEIINEASKDNSACIINLPDNFEKTDNKLKYKSLSANANNLEFCNIDQSERNIIGVSNNENKSGQKTIVDIACKTYYPRKPDGELKSSIPSSSNTDNLEFCKVNNISEEEVVIEKVHLPGEIAKCKNVICVTLSDNEDISEKKSPKCSSSISEHAAKMRNVLKSNQKVAKDVKSKRNKQKKNKKNVNAISNHMSTNQGNSRLSVVTKKAEEVIIERVYLPGETAKCKNIMCITLSDTEDVSEKDSPKCSSSSVSKHAVKMKNSLNSNQKVAKDVIKSKRNKQKKNKKNMNAISNHMPTNHGNSRLCVVTKRAKANFQKCTPKPISKNSNPLVVNNKERCKKRGKQKTKSKAKKLKNLVLNESVGSSLSCMVTSTPKAVLCRQCSETMQKSKKDVINTDLKSIPTSHENSRLHEVVNTTDGIRLQKCTSRLVKNVQCDNPLLSNNEGKKGRKRRKKWRQTEIKSKKAKLTDSVICSSATTNLALWETNNTSKQRVSDELSLLDQSQGKENTSVTVADIKDNVSGESYECSTKQGNAWKLVRKLWKRVKVHKGCISNKQRKKKRNVTSKFSSASNKKSGLCDVTNRTQRCKLPERNKSENALLKNPVIRGLRPIIIDGSNVAIEHGKASRCFSSKGIELAINYFLNRGHEQITAFVPQYRRQTNCQHNFPTVDYEILEDLAMKQFVTFTPSRKINGKCITSYDDRFIVQLASMNGGIIVSNDNYRDLLSESKLFKKTIEKRLLMFCFVGDIFMVPEDPLGRNGPRLKKYLSFPPNKKGTQSI